MTTATTSRTAGETLEALFTFLRRSLMFWKRGTLMFILVAIASVPMVFMKPRVYKSETVVLYQETIRSADLVQGGEGGGDSARRVGAKLREMLLSRASLEPIVKDLPRYAKIADRRGMIDAVDELRGHISFRAREGDTFEIGFEGNTPEEVQDVTRRLGERIVSEASTRRSEQAKTLKEFLDAESDRNKASLRVTEADFSRFLTLHPQFLPLTLPGAGQMGSAPVLPGVGVSAAAAKDPQLYAMEVEAAGIDRQLRAARGQPISAPPSAVAQETPEVIAARKDLAEKQAQYTEKHPDVLAAKARLRAAEAAAKKAPVADDPSPVPAQKLSDADQQALVDRATQLRRAIAARRAGGAAVPIPMPSGSASAGPTGAVALEVEFRRLQREVEDLRERQKQLDEKAFKASITASSVMNDRNIQVSILDPAYLPAHPISRSRSVSLATFLAIGIVVAIMIMLLSARLDDRIYEKSDLEVLDILPVIGAIPRAGKARKA